MTRLISCPGQVSVGARWPASEEMEMIFEMRKRDEKHNRI